MEKQTNVPEATSQARQRSLSPEVVLAASACVSKPEK